MTESPTGFHAHDRERARKGVVLAIAGGAIMAAAKASGFFLRAIFGGEMWGLYAVAWGLTELLAFFLVAGFADAAVIFGSRALHADEEARAHHGALGKIVLIPFGLALLAAFTLNTLAPWLHSFFWGHYSPVFVDLLRLLAWSLPLLVLVQVPAEATRATLSFGPAVGVVQIALPLLSLAFTIALYYLAEPSILAVAQGALLALGCCAPLSLYFFSHAFGLRQPWAGLTDWVTFREPLRFAVPQSLNMMLNQGLNRMDSIMLSLFGVGANAIGVYSLVSELTQVIRMAKMAFSGVYSPLVAKYGATGNKQGIVQALEDTAQKTSFLGLLLLMGAMLCWPLAVLRADEVWAESVYFPWLLTIGPMMSAFFGLCGNTLLMLGHSRLLLRNAMVSGAVNVVLNALFIPLGGLLGAAFATAVASVTISTLQLLQLRRLEQISPHPRIYLRNLVAASVGVTAAFVGSTLYLTPTGWRGDLAPVHYPRLALLGACIVTYLFLQAILPGRFAFRRTDSERSHAA